MPGCALGFDPPVGADASTLARCTQARLERITFSCHAVELFAKQRIGALQLLMPQQQALYPIGNLVELGLTQHRLTIVELGAGLG